MSDAGEGDASLTGEQDAPAETWIGRKIARQAASGSLRVSFQGREDGDAGLQELALSLPPSLSSLELSIPGAAGATDEGVRALAAGIKQLPGGLTHLDLNFNSCTRLTESSFTALVDALEGHNRLLHLALDFSICGCATDYGLEWMSEMLSKKERLTHLSLNFHGCLQISDTGLMSMEQGLTPLIRLRSLSLCLAQLSDRVSGQGLKSIVTALAPMTELEHVCLNCANFADFPDSVFVTLCTSLSQKDKLTRLTIDASGSTTLTQMSTRSFKDVTQAGKLESLILNFSNCRRMYDPGLKDLVDTLKALPSLSFLKIHIGGTPVTQDGLTTAQAALQAVPQLKITRLLRTPEGVALG